MVPALPLVSAAAPTLSQMHPDPPCPPRPPRAPALPPTPALPSGTPGSSLALRSVSQYPPRSQAAAPTVPRTQSSLARSAPSGHARCPAPWSRSLLPPSPLLSRLGGGFLARPVGQPASICSACVTSRQAGPPSLATPSSGGLCVDCRAERLWAGRRPGLAGDRLGRQHGGLGALDEAASLVGIWGFRIKTWCSAGPGEACQVSASH